MVRALPWIRVGGVKICVEKNAGNNYAVSQIKRIYSKKPSVHVRNVTPVVFWPALASKSVSFTKALFKKRPFR